jgi:hypothetical protein
MAGIAVDIEYHLFRRLEGEPIWVRQVKAGGRVQWFRGQIACLSLSLDKPPVA